MPVCVNVDSILTTHALLAMRLRYTHIHVTQEARLCIFVYACVQIYLFIYMDARVHV